MTKAKRLCGVEGCIRPYLAKGLCNMHWQRVNRTGKAELATRPQKEIVKGKVPLDVSTRFWRNVDKSGDCWIWTAGTNASGYGMFAMKTTKGWRPHIASRVSYELTHGPIDPSLFVRHRCDYPPCVNPHHLELGTHLENMQDMRDRGRSLTGSSHPGARFTERQVSEIKARIAGPESNAAIARSLGVSGSTIDAIANGKNWKNVK